MAKGIAGYPFGEMTEVYTYRAEVGSNWKLFIDAFAEFYHAPVLHAKQAVREEADKLLGYGFEGLHYELRPALDDLLLGRDGPAQGLEHGQADRTGPAQRAVRPLGPARHRGPGLLPPRPQPRPAPAWGIDSFAFYPNFMLLIWAPGWYLTYHYWPTAVNRHLFEASLYFVPPKTARERLAQELAGVTFKEYALQDGNTLEATQTMLAPGPSPSSPSTTRRSFSVTCTRSPATWSRSTPMRPLRRCQPGSGRSSRTWPGRCPRTRTLR